MDCQEIKSELGSMLDHELEPAKVSMTQSHIAHCAECRWELERLRELKTAMQKVEPPLASAALDERVMETFRKRHKTVSGWRGWLFNSFAIPKPALALISALLLTAIALAYKAGQISGTELQVVTSPELILKPPPQAIETTRVVYIKMAGGRRRPNSGSSLMFASKGSIKPAGEQPVAKADETHVYDYDHGIYTTSNALESIEPVKDANVQIIKGGNK